MQFIGANYKVTDGLTARLHHAVLKNIYQQQYLSFVHVAPVGDGLLTSDLCNDPAEFVRIPASVTGHSGHRDRFAHGHRAGVGFVL